MTGDLTTTQRPSDDEELQLQERPLRKVRRLPKSSRRRKFNRLIGTFIGAILTLGAAYASQLDKSSPSIDADNASPVISKVVDGDTVKVKLNGKTLSVRLIGIDTPETVDPRRPVGCYGKEASNFTKSLLPPGTSVYLVSDVEQKDKYGRLLAYVYRSSDGLFINAKLASEGYAQVLTIAPNVAHADQFVELVNKARAENKGLWRACSEASAK